MLNAVRQFIYNEGRSLPVYLRNSLKGMACMSQSCEFLHAIFEIKREITARKFPKKVGNSTKVIKYTRR
jgi:hypothetical protein